MIYFTEIVGGERRILQEARNQVYEKLKKFPPDKKLELANLSYQTAERLSIPIDYQKSLYKYMKDNFGFDDETEEEVQA